jgi:DnaK suppressor protein
MASKAKVKGKTVTKASPAKSGKTRPTSGTKSGMAVKDNGASDGAAKTAVKRDARYYALHRMLAEKRAEIMNEIGESLGQSLTEDQQRRLEATMDVGDQALMDLDRELGISLMEMRNRKRQLIDEALTRLEEGQYGVCAECGVEISEKRLAVVPFAKLCVTCQSQQELIEKIEKGEERE